ncbi:MAG: hypothetical protein A2901_00430 [Elusimicrobia bacterium RIFCSPLOWO2_01_FULL_54_10]|nr:MAG: hypothetical protein A2901_00430 [Elusimicrobia bacterium RIFCSPLOWO2_01_FULL_54_10]
MARILIADDEPTILQFCTFALEREKHTIITAETGPDALAKLKASKPDLLLLDVMLPGMDGYTLQLQMAEDERLFRVPVIVMSALKPALSLFSKFAQVSASLVKPFQPEELNQAVNRALNDERIKELKYHPYM